MTIFLLALGHGLADDEHVLDVRVTLTLRSEVLDEGCLHRCKQPDAVVHLAKFGLQSGFGRVANTRHGKEHSAFWQVLPPPFLPGV